MCCHNPSGTHYADEPDDCCHVHAEDLPGNTGNAAEVEPPIGWTVQKQFERPA